MITKIDLKKPQVLKLDGFRVFVDAEWTSGNIPISVQVLIVHPDGFRRSFIVLNELYHYEINHDLLKKWKEKNSAEIVFYNLNDDLNVVHKLLKDFYLKSDQLENTDEYFFCGEVFMFFSFQDLGFAFGWNNIEKQLKKEISLKSKRKIEQRRSITGTLKIEDVSSSKKSNWRIRDLSGITNVSLKEFASSLGINMKDKGKLDDLKSSMDLALLNRTEIFLDYGLGDVLVLEKIFISFLSLVNDTISNTLGLPSKFLFTESSLPLTTGSLVAETFERYVFHHAQTSSQKLYYNFLKRKGITSLPDKKIGPNTPFYLALWSLSLFRKSHTKKAEYLSIFKNLYNSDNLDDIFQKSLDHGETLSKWVCSSPFESLPFSASSIKTLGQGDARTTSLLNCLVSGGRANNELPSQYKLNKVLDVDLQSCYGTALKSLVYPIGLPTIVAFAPNENKITLKSFLERYNKELLPGLYKITVSGKLNFHQDLLFSKVTTCEKMRDSIANFSQKFESENEDVVHFANDFVLAKKECLNAVLTHDLLEIIKQVASNNEYKEIMNLQVETAIFWKKSNQCTSCSEWVEGVLKTPGEMVFDQTDQSICDTRSRLWYALPLEGFIGRLVSRRNEIKKQSKQEVNEVEKIKLKGLQNILKLFINTLYGCLASPYFSIGNVVFADNITAKARCNVWLMCKALNLRQSITDGGIYSPLQVNYFNDDFFIKKPGLATLSDVRKLKKHRSISTKALLDKDWSLYFENGTIFEHLKNIDQIVYDHINNFWEPYNLKLTIPIEHKVENTALVGIYTGKANYALLVYNEESNSFDKKYFRLRGARVGEGDFYPVIYSLHDQLLSGIDDVSIPQFNKTRRILRLATWRIRQTSTSHNDLEKSVRPGQIIEQKVYFYFRDSHYPQLTILDFLKKKRSNFTSSQYMLKDFETFSEFHKRITWINELKIDE